MRLQRIGNDHRGSPLRDSPGSPGAIGHPERDGEVVEALNLALDFSPTAASPSRVGGSRARRRGAASAGAARHQP